MNLNNSNKRLAKNTLLLNVRLIVTLLISLYSSRMVLQVLGIEDYGLYNLVGGFVALLSVITCSITSTASRFITVELGKGDLEALNSTFCSMVNVLVILSIFIIIFATIVGPWFIINYLTIPQNKIDIALIVFSCSVFVFVLNMLSVPYTALVTAHENMDFYALMSIYDSVSKLLIILFLKFNGEDKLILYAFLLAIAALFNRLIYSAYCSKKFEESKFHFVFNKAKIKQVFSFSVWMGIGSAVGILKDQVGNIIINMFFGLVLNASMGIATQIKGVVLQFGNSIGTAISPQITKSFASDNIQRAFYLTFLYVKCVGIFMLIIGIPLLFETHYILKIWLGTFPNYTVAFVRLTIGVVFLNVITQGFGPIFLAKGNIRQYQIIAACIILTYIPICYVCLKLLLNPLTCLLVSLFFESILIFSNYYCLKLKVGFPFVDFLKRVIIRLCIVVLITSFVLSLIQNVIVNESFFRLALSLLVSTIVVILLSLFVLFNKNERKKIRSILIRQVQ